jgi:hypothetical protein
VTPGGEKVLRIKAMLLGAGVPERHWRESRARNLAKMIAWHRRAIRLRQPGEPRCRLIVEEIVDDIGWPRMRWLKPMVRAEQRRIEQSLAEFQIG